MFTDNRPSPSSSRMVGREEDHVDGYQQIWKQTPRAFQVPADGLPISHEFDVIQKVFHSVDPHDSNHLQERKTKKDCIVNFVEL